MNKRNVIKNAISNPALWPAVGRLAAVRSRQAIREPSTWSALAAIVGAVLTACGVDHAYTAAVVGATGAVGVVMSEKGSAP